MFSAIKIIWETAETGNLPEASKADYTFLVCDDKMVYLNSNQNQTLGNVQTLFKQLKCW